MPHTIAIADAVDALRQDLEEAIEEGFARSLQFELDRVELELHAGFTKTGSAGATVKWWVVELGAEGTLASTATQTVRLILKPRRHGLPDAPLLLERPD
jgi:hypothetical protein